MTEDETVGYPHQLNGHEFEQTQGCSISLVLLFCVALSSMVVCPTNYSSVGSVAQLCPTLCDPMNSARQASLSITNSQRLPKLMSIESVMPSNRLILCHPLLLPSIFPSIRVFSNESAPRIRWPKSWEFQH